MIEINGTKLPTPSVYMPRQYDLDSENSGANEKGFVIRERLRQGIYKIEMEWRGIDNAKTSKILDSIKPPKFTVRFLTESGYKTKSMYVGDRHMKLVRYMGSQSLMAWDLSLNLVEC